MLIINFVEAILEMEKVRGLEYLERVLEKQWNFSIIFYCCKNVCREGEDVYEIYSLLDISRTMWKNTIGRIRTTETRNSVVAIFTKC